jgi:hypothetical protein
MTGSEAIMVGDQLSPWLSWTAGGEGRMDHNMVKVPMLGTQDDSFFCPPDLFFNAAFKIGADPLFEPPPFACPCTDGLLIIYTMCRRHHDGSVDVCGAYIFMSCEQLERECDLSISRHWKNAAKPADTTTMLRRLGFGDVEPQYLN